MMDNNQSTKPEGVSQNAPLSIEDTSSDVNASVGNSSITKLDNNGSNTIKLDDLGPMGWTLSRIANWNKMTEPERERTLRVLTARNRLRLANEEKKQRSQEGGTAEQSALSIMATSATSASSEPAMDSTAHASSSGEKRPQDL